MQTAVPIPTRDDQDTIQQIVDRHKVGLPAGVRRMEIEYGEDWTGYPTVRINFIVGKDVESTQEFIKNINDFNKIIGNEIIDLKSYWPFVRIVREE